MKYIRTKDKVREFDDSCDIGYISQMIDGIKIGNSIQEVADGYYIDYENESFNVENIYEHYVQFKDQFAYDKSEGTLPIGYAFIKTDKGLIFIGKMNPTTRELEYFAN